MQCIFVMYYDTTARKNQRCCNAKCYKIPICNIYFAFLYFSLIYIWRRNHSIVITFIVISWVYYNKEYLLTMICNKNDDMIWLIKCFRTQFTRIINVNINNKNKYTQIFCLSSFYFSRNSNQFLNRRLANYIICVKG